MKLIIGLGNPGERYAGTRHNVGFLMLDAFADARGVMFKAKTKFNADIAEISEAGDKVLLVKSRSYYNDTGITVRTLSDFYDIATEDILVIHDELMLPFGTIRTRRGGSSAGNNGIKSISQHIGESTARLRVGVYTELREQMDATDYVLGKFNQDERTQLEKLTHVAIGCIDDFIYARLDATTHQVA